MPPLRLLSERRGVYKLHHGQGKKAAYPEGFFGEVSFDEAPVALGADFFAIYEKYAGQ